MRPRILARTGFHSTAPRLSDSANSLYLKSNFNRVAMRRKNLLAWLIVLCLGIIGTVQYHLAQFSSRFDTFFGDRGDARGVVYFCEHWYQSFLGKANLLSPGLFYSTKGTLAYSDLLVGYAIPYSLLRGLGFEMFSAMEIVIIGLTFLSYLGCFILLNRALHFNLLPSCAGAMFFAFSSPKFFQLLHLQLQFVVCLPLIFLFVILFVQQSATLTQKRAFALLSLSGLAFNIQLLTAFYLGWFFSLWCFLFLILALLFQPSRRFIFLLTRKFWPAMSASAATFLLGAVPFMLVYLPRASERNWYTYSNVKEMIPAWWSLLSMGDGNYVWGWLASIVRPKPAPAYWAELTTGIGVFTSLAWVGITIFGLWIVIRTLRSRSAKKGNEDRLETRRVYLLFLGLMILATTLFYCIGMKYGNGHSLWKHVYHTFPGAKAIRAMSRYVIFLTLPTTVGFAFALDYGIKRVSAQKTSLARSALMFGLLALAAVGVFEQFGTFKVGGTGFSKKAETAYLNAMAARLDGNCAAFYVAAKPDDHHAAAEYQYDAMMIAVMTHIPTLNGTSSQFPPGWFGLYEVKDPAYEVNVRKWIEQNKIKGNICRLEIGPQVEDFSSHAPNPIADPSFFVSQQYRDFLDREPVGDEAHGLAEQVKSCKPNDASCTPAAISLGLFHSTGFFDQGSLVFRLYEVGLGRMPRFEEFISDMRRLGANTDSDHSEMLKESFISEFVQAPEFVSRYEGMSDSQYLNMLLKTAQVSSSPQLLKAVASQNTRSQILRKIAESGEVPGKFTNQAFVALQYFGYLRRDPEEGGFNRWLDELNKTGDFAHVTSGFVDSSEYRERFGSSILP